MKKKSITLFLALNLLMALFVPFVSVFPTIYAQEATTTMSQEETTTITETSLADSQTLQLFVERSQDNKMIELAWEDYQQVNDYTFFDLTKKEIQGVTTFEEIVDNFKTSLEDVEVLSNFDGEAITVLSYTYKDPTGEIHPKRLIEDWARIEFYFLGDFLVYAGISTMSFAFEDGNAFPGDMIETLVDANHSVEDLAKVKEFEANGLGQVVSDGKVYYGLAFPVIKADSQIGDVAVLSIQDDKILDSLIFPAEAVIQYSYVSLAFTSLINLVPNDIFIQEY